MAETTRGIVYPTSGDNIAPLETHFSALASTTDAALDDLAAEIGTTAKVGYKNFTGPTAAASTVDVAVTFPTAFTSAPYVVCTVQGGASSAPYFAYILGTPSINGFTARVYKMSGTTAQTDLYLHWMAK